MLSRPAQRRRRQTMSLVLLPIVHCSVKRSNAKRRLSLPRSNQYEPRNASNQRNSEEEGTKNGDSNREGVMAEWQRIAQRTHSAKAEQV
jgi:hypothetical protein